MNIYDKQFLFDFDGALNDSEGLQNLCKYLLERDCDVCILTSRISGLEDPNFKNLDGIEVSKQWKNRFGVSYEDLDQHSDVYALATDLDINPLNVLFTEGVNKAKYLLHEGYSDVVLFDDSVHEIEAMKETFGDSEIVIEVVRCKKTFEDYLKELNEK